MNVTIIGAGYSESRITLDRGRTFRRLVQDVDNVPDPLYRNLAQPIWAALVVMYESLIFDGRNRYGLGPFGDRWL